MDGVNRGKYTTKQYAVNIAGNTHPETLFDWRESKLPIRKSFGRQKIFLWKRSSEIIIKYLFTKITLGMSVPYGI